MKPVIREATLDDFRGIVELAKEFAILENQNDPTLWKNWPLEPKTQEFFKKCITDNDRLALVMEDEQQIVGYLMAWRHEAMRDRKETNLVIIENVYLREDYRGKRLGREMVDKTVEWTKSIGANRLSVSAFSTNNTAIDFYKKAGFSDYKLTLEKEV